MQKTILGFPLFALILPIMTQAQSLQSCNNQLDSLLHSIKYQEVIYKGKVAKKVTLDIATQRFKAHFNESFTTNPKMDFAGKYVVTIWGCGSPCLNVGLVNFETGKASIGPNYSFSVEYLPTSQVIITDRPESQEQINSIKWLAPAAYLLKRGGRFDKLYECDFN